ncbi:IGHMBP2 family helicase [uncultured Methanobrevibacter sp.]|uniref:IGHMBP2 family helicase n=1 Tax=uncultured Methanobrevibacter sp. TaxID=253161 RepID=UPI002616CAA4|nr:IGHMBP2 family helicase [uncultured Methanobrevibacter sp.]
MKKYIKQLIKLINYERDAEIELMTNEIKNLSPKKREDLGRAINKVKGKYLGKQLGSQIVQFGRSQKIETEISIGDMVLISTGYPLRSDLTGTVVEKGARFLKVAFEKSIPKWALKKKVRIDLYANDITFKRMEDNLLHLSTKGKNALEYSLKKRDPKESKKEKYVDFIDTSLNQSQKNAVKNAINTENFFLIHGPFGTGKTRTLVELIQQEVRQKNKVLVTSESNSAVDNILDRLSKNKKLNVTRLGHPQRVSKENIQYSLAYKAENHQLTHKINKNYKKIEQISEIRDRFTKPTPQYRRGFSDSDILYNASKGKGGRGISPSKMESMANWLLENEKIDDIHDKIKKLENKIIKDIVGNSNVILSTNSTSAIEEISRTNFDVVIVDEASQATIPSVLIPLAKARRFILAGDHKQLPPTIISKKAHPLEKTLFEELIKKYPNKSCLLNVQYRMNSFLMKFPNSEFYKGNLKSDSQVDNININEIIDLEKISNLKENRFKEELHNNSKPLLFIDTSNLKDNEEKHLKDSKSIINQKEAEIATKITKYYLENGVKLENIGIISPYSDQVHLIQDKTSVEVKSVDGFQGREKEIIIISTVRSNENGNIGFLKDLRRLNVALTRAKRKLIIIGNVKTLKENPTYSRLIKFCNKNDLLINFRYT